jgi:hypothetical protein
MPGVSCPTPPFMHRREQPDRSDQLPPGPDRSQKVEEPDRPADHVRPPRVPPKETPAISRNCSDHADRWIRAEAP